MKFLLPTPFGLFPLGHVPKARPYWRAGYVSPSVGFFERPNSHLSAVIGFNVAAMFGKAAERIERSCVYFTKVLADAAQ